MSERSEWASRSTFILAAVGSAVGLGNAWRFPGLLAEYGGGAFILVYLVAMIVLGIPLLTMELAIGRKMRQGAPGALRGLNKKFEPIGWAATTNAFIITCYYAVVFAWVLLMAAVSYKFAGMTGDTDTASNLFVTMIQTTGDVNSSFAIPGKLLIALVVAWGLIYYCIRDGAKSVGKVIKYTVFLPVILLLVMAIRGCTMPGAAEGLAKMWIPDFTALSQPQLWVDAVGQVFFSLSIMMAIMFAYGSFLHRDNCIAADATIIAFSDMAVSLLAGVVMFTTMSATGMLDNMTASGISTAFIVYPQAIVLMSGSGVFNAIFGLIFYLTLATLAIDSAFSIVEGAATAFADKFRSDHKKTTIIVCCIAGVISIWFTTRAGLAWLDIVDNWTNQYNMVIVGIFECAAVGWFFKTSKVLDEANKNSKGYKLPAWWFNTSIKVIAPILLSILVIWNLVSYFTSDGGYGGYPMWAQIAGGWSITILAFISGFIIKAVAKAKGKDSYPDEKTWDEME